MAKVNTVGALIDDLLKLDRSMPLFGGNNVIVGGSGYGGGAAFIFVKNGVNLGVVTLGKNVYADDCQQVPDELEGMTGLVIATSGSHFEYQLEKLAEEEESDDDESYDDDSDDEECGRGF